MMQRLYPVLALIGCVCAGCGGTCPPASAAVAQDSKPERAPETPENHRAAVKKLLALMDMEKTMQLAMDQALETQLKANPQLADLADVLRDFLAEHMSWSSLEGDFVDMYAESFSQREIEDMLAFYKTPTGQRAAAMAPVLMKKGGELGTTRVQQHLPDLQRRIRERLQEIESGAR